MLFVGAPGDLPAEGGLDPGSAEGDEKKKRRARKKSKLEDMFPPYLQVGWADGNGVGWEQMGIGKMGENRSGQGGGDGVAQGCTGGVLGY